MRLPFTNKLDEKKTLDSITKDCEKCDMVVKSHGISTNRIRCWKYNGNTQTMPKYGR